jgi:dTDP-4-amino-4,6-dideoxygalactose transaminase
MPGAERIEGYFKRSRDAHWYSNDGPCANLLCARLAERLGEEVRCTAVSSGTTGLMVALRAVVGERPRAREVIVPSFTYVATVSAVLWSGLTPVFLDVSPDHWHLSPQELREVLERRAGRIAAVLACSTFGCAPPRAVSEAWERACAAAGVPLVVDSAAGFGSRDDAGRPLGLLGDAEVVSFHATKPLAAGEGGAVFAREEAVARRVARQTTFGLDEQRVLAEAPGFNAKMSEIHAAITLAALDSFETTLAARRERAAALRAGLEDHGYRFQPGAERSACQFVPALAPTAARRAALLGAADRAAVQLRTYHEPLHLMPPLRGYAVHGELPVTRELSARMLSLPLANDLTDAEIERVRALLLMQR